MKKTLLLESEGMTTLAAATSQNSATALGAGTDQKAVRADTLDLGGLIRTLGSHDNSLPCSKGKNNEA